MTGDTNTNRKRCHGRYDSYEEKLHFVSFILPFFAEVLTEH